MKITIDDIKETVLNMPVKEKDKLLLLLLKKNTQVVNKIYYQKVASQEDLEYLVDYLKSEMNEFIADTLFKKGNLQKGLARAIGKATKAIGQYKSVLTPEKEAEILLHLLDVIFDEFSNKLGTCWTAFDHKVAQTLSKIVTLVTKKMHEDYRIEFEEQVNNYLFRLKKVSSHLDYVYNLPDKLVY